MAPQTASRRAHRRLWRQVITGVGRILTRALITSALLRDCWLQRHRRGQPALLHHLCVKLALRRSGVGTHLPATFEKLTRKSSCSGNRDDTASVTDLVGSTAYRARREGSCHGMSIGVRVDSDAKVK